MTMGESADYPVIKCEDCGFDYILIAVMGLNVPEEEKYDHDISLMNQISTYFCPYCGKDQKKSKKEDVVK